MTSLKRGIGKGRIENLQEEGVSLKRSISEAGDYIDAGLGKAPKLRKYEHFRIEEEPGVVEVR